MLLVRIVHKLKEHHTYLPYYIEKNGGLKTRFMDKSELVTSLIIDYGRNQTSKVIPQSMETIELIQNKNTIFFRKTLKNFIAG